ncbi:carbohydrate ABC transporter permease [Isoptericola sp. NPDC057653]|uniref:carbohydrate ABC transporter permease n=1 Tax=Isoptericola sp. NPDC057653 TaxID=3346195 RepID=UPI0036C6ADE6
MTAAAPAARTAVAVAGRTGRPPRRAASRTLWIWVFLVATIVLFGAYTVWPAIASVGYSFLGWSGYGPDRPFVGLANYERAFSDPLFWRSVGVTLLIIVVTVPLRVLLALVLAVFLNDPRLPFARLLRTAFFVPVVATTAIIGIVMNFVLDPADGPVNQVLGALGIQPVDFLGDSSAALWSVMAVHFWKWLGLTLVYWLAALQTVPDEVHEAARVDGANARQRFWHVTVPMLTPFLVVISLLTIVETMQIFDLVQTMTGGGPYFATLVTEVYIYQQAFETARPEYGYASAIGVLLGVLTLLVVGTAALVSRLAARKGADR